MTKENVEGGILQLIRKGNVLHLRNRQLEIEDEMEETKRAMIVAVSSFSERATAEAEYQRRRDLLTSQSTAYFNC